MTWRLRKSQKFYNPSEQDQNQPKDDGIVVVLFISSRVVFRLIKLIMVWMNSFSENSINLCLKNPVWVFCFCNLYFSWCGLSLRNWFLSVPFCPQTIIRYFFYIIDVVVDVEVVVGNLAWTRDDILPVSLVKDSKLIWRTR